MATYAVCDLSQRAAEVEVNRSIVYKSSLPLELVDRVVVSIMRVTLDRGGSFNVVSSVRHLENL